MAAICCLSARRQNDGTDEAHETVGANETYAGHGKWWPDELGHAPASGSENGVRYAFFPDKQRLLIEENGNLRIYDSGDHRINGVSQQQSHGHSLAFTSQSGVVDLDELRRV